MKAYKSFERTEDGKLMSLGTEYKPGYLQCFDLLQQPNEGKKGFICYHELPNAWFFTPNNGLYSFWEVECGGEIKEWNVGRLICSEIRLVKEIDTSNVVRFDNAHFYKEGFVAIRQGEKYNHINKDGVLLSEQWFDCTWTFNNGAALVKLNHQFNFIGKDGKLLYETWFDKVFLDSKGICIINSDKECWRIDKNWNIIK